MMAVLSKLPEIRSRLFGEKARRWTMSVWPLSRAHELAGGEIEEADIAGFAR
jgi:hypothetical protein